MGTWATGVMGRWIYTDDGYVFHLDVEGLQQMVKAMDESGQQATVTEQRDAVEIVILAWRVKID